MKKQLLILILFVSTIIGLTNCKKYPEDGKTSLASAKSRLKNAQWKLESYEVDGSDSTHNSYAFDICGPDSYRYELHNVILIFDGKKVKTENDVLESKWDFNEHKNILQFYLWTYQICCRGCNAGFDKKCFPHDYTQEWVIKRLTNKELILQMNTSIKNIRVKFRNLQK